MLSNNNTVINSVNIKTIYGTSIVELKGDQYQQLSIAVNTDAGSAEVTVEQATPQLGTRPGPMTRSSAREFKNRNYSLQSKQVSKHSVPSRKIAHPQQKHRSVFNPNQMSNGFLRGNQPNFRGGKVPRGAQVPQAQPQQQQRSVFNSFQAGRSQRNIRGGRAQRGRRGALQDSSKLHSQALKSGIFSGGVRGGRGRGRGRQGQSQGRAGRGSGRQQTEPTMLPIRGQRNVNDSERTCLIAARLVSQTKQTNGGSREIQQNHNTGSLLGNGMENKPPNILPTRTISQGSSSSQHQQTITRQQKLLEALNSNISRTVRNTRQSAGLQSPSRQVQAYIKEEIY